MIIVYVGGYVGARGLSMMMFGEEFSALWRLGRMTLYGGLLLGGGCGFAFALLRGLPLRILWNLAGVAILLGIGIGRIGCFLNGDDFGSVISLGSPWSVLGVSFPNLEDPAKGLIRHPVQLYESFFTLGAGIFCYLRYPQLVKSRVSLGLGLISYYAVVRFCMEFLRADDRGVLLSSGLSPSQEISLLVLMGCCLVFMLPKKKAFKEP
jgi:phosphatidylglycerol:prolipoprotein diacylglycerol transferase